MMATVQFTERLLLPNGVRLSCGAEWEYSQMQFYQNGRRQLQPLVRLRAISDLIVHAAS